LVVHEPFAIRTGRFDVQEIPKQTMVKPFNVVLVTGKSAGCPVPA